MITFKIISVLKVKECLQGDQKTPFQTFIFELRNTVMNSYWNKEVGKTRYQIPNLPKGMDPLETTFGKKTESGTKCCSLSLESKQLFHLDNSCHSLN